jgi:hypothetical protein
MDLLWKPVVHSPTQVDIPQVTLTYEPAALAGWKKANKPWLHSERKDHTVWGKYAELAESGRFLLPYDNEPPARRFAELHAALLLEREGFHCWGVVLLFDYDRKMNKGKGNTKANTEEVRSLAPWRWPSEIQNTLNFQPRNPDIVAWSKARGEWRFCEVKGPGDRINPDQLKALAVLYLLTGAPVAVLRVVEVAADSAVQMRSAEIAYRKRGHLDWIQFG